MGLWFKKKIEKEDVPVVAKTPDVKQTSGTDLAKTSPFAKTAPLPSVPLPNEAPKTFKLPPVSPAQTVASAPAAPAVPPVSAATPLATASSSQATAEAIAEAIKSRITPASLYANPAASSLADEKLPEAQPAPLAPKAEIPKVNVPELKPVLKPIILKPKIQVADKTEVAPPKTEVVAADMPAMPRTDPKVLYYQLMNGLYDVIFVLDDDGHVIDCNSRSEEIFGYSPDDVWNMPIEKIVYGMNNRMFNLLKKNLTNKRHILIDARCFRSIGTSFLAEVGVSTVQLTRSQNVVFSIRNVERRKNSAEELRKYRAALDILPIAAFTCDLHGSFEVLNPLVLRALGMVDEMEAQKKHFGEMLPDMIPQFQAAVKGAEISESKELTRPDGTTYTIELRLKPMRRGEEITGVAGTMTMT